MSAEMSPVCAPARSALQSWPPTAMSVSSRISATRAIWVAGGQTSRSQSNPSQLSRKAAARLAASPVSPFIFQLPAIS